jgi:hypothetical protein
VFHTPLAPLRWLAQVTPENMCVLNMAVDYLCGFGDRPMNTTCLADIKPPDFEGASSDAQQVSKATFGTTDLWNGMQAQ